jgi:hypothetical protein
LFSQFFVSGFTIQWWMQVNMALTAISFILYRLRVLQFALTPFVYKCRSVRGQTGTHPAFSSLKMKDVQSVQAFRVLTLSATRLAILQMTLCYFKELIWLRSIVLKM